MLCSFEFIDEAVLKIVINEWELFAQLLNMIADLEEKYGKAKIIK